MHTPRRNSFVNYLAPVLNASHSHGSAQSDVRTKQFANGDTYSGSWRNNYVRAWLSMHLCHLYLCCLASVSTSAPDKHECLASMPTPCASILGSLNAPALSSAAPRGFSCWCSQMARGGIYGQTAPGTKAAGRCEQHIMLVYSSCMAWGLLHVHEAGCMHGIAGSC